MKTYLKTIPLAVLITLSGCAVSPMDIWNMKDSATQNGESALKQSKTQLKQEGMLARIKGNYIGDDPIDMPSASKLPSVFFQKISISTKSSAFGSVTQAAKNIGIATGLSVRVNPDVDGVVSTTVQQQQLGNNNQALMAIQNANQINSKTPVRLDFDGQLLTYVNMVADSAGVNWEYVDGSLNFFRLATQTFTIHSANPGEISFTDSMSKGASATTGSTGTSNASANGSFSSTSSVSSAGNYSVWKLLTPVLTSALSTVGKISINEASGTVTVTDTRDALTRITKIIDKQNTILSRQVAIDVRVIKVALNDETSAGINLNAVYNSIQNGVTKNVLTLAAPANLASQSAGSLSFVMNGPPSLNGSSAAIQALNQFGTIASDSTSSVVTTNRVPAMTGAYATTGFLAQTTPANGGATTAGTGVPGLTPGSVTTGTFLRVTPTVRENDTILMAMSLDLSNLDGIGSAQTGSGQTLQQIQWANTDGTKTTSNLVLNKDQSMVTVGLVSESVNSTSNNGFSGASADGKKSKSIFVVIVTPRILRGL